MRRSLYIFIFLLISLSAGVIILTKSLSERAPYIVQVYMLTPALAAILTRLCFYDSKFKNSYLRFGKLGDYGRFYLVSLGITLLSFVMYTLLNAVRWDLSGEIFLDNLAQMISAGGQDISSLPPGFTPKTMLFVFSIGGLTVFNILPGLVTGLGEELGWRDFLFPQLLRVNPRTAFVVGGLIWFFWHLPLSVIIPQTQSFELWQQLVNMIILAVGSIFSFIYLAYVYVRSQSVMVTAFAHIAINNSSGAFSYFVIIQDQVLANLGLTLTMIMVTAAFCLTGKFRVFKGYLDSL
jgi:membrane protease YdiL (CAAX protease family)